MRGTWWSTVNFGGFCLIHIEISNLVIIELLEEPFSAKLILRTVIDYFVQCYINTWSSNPVIKEVFV
jgi:hypothetical protein